MDEIATTAITVNSITVPLLITNFTISLTTTTTTSASGIITTYSIGVTATAINGAAAGALALLGIAAAAIGLFQYAPPGAYPPVLTMVPFGYDPYAVTKTNTFSDGSGTGLSTHAVTATATETATQTQNTDCKILTIKLFAPNLQTPIPFPPLGPIATRSGANLNVLGPYNDPAGVGEFRNIHWIVFTGMHLDLCDYNRWVRMTSHINNPDPERAIQTAGRGWLGPNALAEEGVDQHDGPGSHELYVSPQLVVVADAPGFPEVGHPSFFPITAGWNFEVVARSQKTGDEKGAIWYYAEIDASG